MEVRIDDPSVRGVEVLPTVALHPHIALCPALVAKFCAEPSFTSDT